MNTHLTLFLIRPVVAGDSGSIASAPGKERAVPPRQLHSEILGTQSII
jgi:hypothetical protein